MYPLPLLTLWSLVAAGPERPGPLATLAPHAAGLCLAEVTDLRTFDTRPSDGPRYVRVTLRVLRRSGAVPGHIDIITDFGGLLPPGAPAAPRLVLQRYKRNKTRRWRERLAARLRCWW